MTVLASVLASSCRLLGTAAAAPGRVVDAILPAEAQGPPIERQFADLIRYLDVMVLRVEEASREFEVASGTPAAEIQGAKLRLEAIRWAVRLVVGPNSLANALDMVVLAATFRWMQEDYWIPEVWGEAARPLQVAFQRVEDDGWELLERYLDEPSITDARRVLARWREKNQLVQSESFTEYPSFRTLVEGQPTDADGDPRSLLGLIGFDPVSVLEPAAREFAQTREFGVRALFFLQHAPRLVAAELEYRVLRARASDEVQQAFDNAERLTATLESIAATAAALPEAVRQEREDLVRDLEQSEEPVARLLEETQATLAAGERMSAEVNAAVAALDAFVGRFDGPQPAAAVSGEPRRPFDVTEYGQAAERIGVGASQLIALVDELDRKLPEFQLVLDTTVARGERSMNRVALRFLEVGLVLIAAAALAGWLLLRRASRRLRAGDVSTESAVSTPPAAKPRIRKQLGLP